MFLSSGALWDGVRRDGGTVSKFDAFLEDSSGAWYLVLSGGVRLLGGRRTLILLEFIDRKHYVVCLCREGEQRLRVTRSIEDGNILLCC